MPGWFWKYVPYFPTDLGAEIFGSPFLCVPRMTEALTTQISPIPASAASSPSTMGLPSPSFTPLGFPSRLQNFCLSRKSFLALLQCLRRCRRRCGSKGSKGSKARSEKTGPIPWQGAPRLLQLLIAVVEERPVLFGEYGRRGASMHPHIEWNYFNGAMVPEKESTYFGYLHFPRLSHWSWGVQYIPYIYTVP